MLYNQIIYRRDYSKFDEKKLIEDVQSVKWEDVLPATEDVNSIFESFHTKLTEIIDNHVPLRKLSKKSMCSIAKIWITKGLRVSIAKKNKIYKKYLNSKNNYYFSKFKIYRNKLNHLLLRSKKMYYNNYFANSKYNIKETWRGIKQLITLKQSNYSFPSVLEVGGTKLTASKAIANAFNDYFSSIGSDTASAIPTVNTPFETFLNRKICNSFVIFPTSISEI